MAEENRVMIEIPLDDLNGIIFNMRQARNPRVEYQKDQLKMAEATIEALLGQIWNYGQMLKQLIPKGGPR